MQEVVGNQAISVLNADLARQEARLSGVTSRLGEGNLEVIELRANINRLRTRLNAERLRIIDGFSVNNAVNQSRLNKLKSKRLTNTVLTQTLNG